MNTNSDKRNSVHWHEILGNPYIYGLNPLMLGENGYQHKVDGRIKGMKKSSKKIPLIIHFDSNYVTRFIIISILDKLNPSSYQELQRVFTKAWNEWKKSKKRVR